MTTYFLIIDYINLTNNFKYEKELELCSKLFTKIEKYGLREDNTINLNSIEIDKLDLYQDIKESRNNIKIVSLKIIRKDILLWAEIKKKFQNTYIIGPPVPSS